MMKNKNKGSQADPSRLGLDNNEEKKAKTSADIDAAQAHHKKRPIYSISRMTQMARVSF